MTEVIDDGRNAPVAMRSGYEQQAVTTDKGDTVIAIPPWKSKSA
jgi:hypothetical protein